VAQKSTSPFKASYVKTFNDSVADKSSLAELVSRSQNRGAAHVWNTGNP